jgi:hypothetical protein
LFAEALFDPYVEGPCRPCYADDACRASLPPGVYFCMLFVGYFEGLGSQRGMAWRCADSLSRRAFLGVPLNEATADHSGLTKIRQRLPLAVHGRVFLHLLAIAQEKKLSRGKTVAIDPTTLEANAAMKGIVRQVTGGDWRDYQPISGPWKTECVSAKEIRTIPAIHGYTTL